ncbi:MAG: hypothetical protein HN509_00945 [Halobacteriovoraceae bacterium]|jgi:hypothetical protein|nr:hypothetical protein [Halobacteriovoraceae bacterium]MBT5094758.1 hypothetical protein [Halobacteriovoraceae bacterium]
MPFKSSTILIFLLAFSNSYSQEKKVKETPFEYTKRFHSEVEEIKSLEADVYEEKIDYFRSSIEKYIEHKRRVCNGEFSTMVLSEKKVKLDGTKKNKNKLSHEERKLCFREMKALQITFINNMFLARKRYLDHLHQLRVSELGAAREQSIKSVQKAFTKKR